MKSRHKSSSKRRLKKSAPRASLLRQFERLTRESVRINARLADLRAQLCPTEHEATSRSALSTRRPRPLGQSVDLVRDALRVLKKEGAPLPCCEVARRLGIERHAAKYRLHRAVAPGLAKRVDGGLYQVADVVPEISS